MAERVTQQVVEAAGTGQAAAERVTQQIVEAAGTGQTSAERVTQQVVEAAGTGQIPYARVTQLYAEVAALYLLDIISFTTIPSVAQVFTTGGTVALVQPDIPIVGTTTVPSTAQVFAGGTVLEGIPVVGTATISSTKQVSTGGLVTNGIPVVGVSAIPSSAAVNSGGTAQVDVFTFTIAPVSILGYMDLGTIWPGQVLPYNDSPLNIIGSFTYVPASTAAVLSSGIVAQGVYVTGGATIPSTAGVMAAGTVTNGLNLVGAATVPTTVDIPTLGVIHVSAGLVVFGGTTIPSAATILTPGLVVAGLNLIGSLTVPSSASVLLGGALPLLSGAGSMPTTNYWSGFGQIATPTRTPNENDDSLALEALRQRRWLWGVERATQARRIASGGGLGALSGRVECNPAPVAECHKVNLRKNVMPRGKALTPGPLAGDVAVTQFTVPTGYQCVILGYYCVYTGTGFVPGSGDIVWRLRVGNAWARNMGNLLYSVGTVSGTVTLGTAIELDSNQQVTFVVNVPNISGMIQVGASYILCGLQGWIYPYDSWNQRG